MATTLREYLDKAGVLTLWARMKATFAKKSDLAAHPTARVYVGSCSTAAATNPKVCAVEDFPLDAEGKPLVGTLISVKFSATNTSTSTTPQLNVNETGAIRIWYNNAVLAAAKSAYAGYANRYINYMYDGTYWVFLGHSTDNNTTYSALTQAKIDDGTETTGRLISADLLRDNFYTESEVDDLLSGKANTSDIPTVPTNVSAFVNDAGYLTSYTESDPTVPAWAKSATKPSYTPSEIGAQEEITNVNVSVDDNIGTPSGSASFNGGTLNLSFSNLKGEKGDTGETGATGPQGQTGPQGPKGDTGVSGDASDLAIIHSVDQNTTYNDTDVAGADAAQTTDKNLIDDEYALFGILENLHKTKASKDEIPDTEEMELVAATAIIDIKEKIIRKASCHQITVSSRPTNPTVGEHYYDTTIHKPIWWSGTNWTDALGNNV